jgi:hypothetical protein
LNVITGARAWKGWNVRDLKISRNFNGVFPVFST